MRCYNGQPDEALQALLDAHAAIHAELRKHGLKATYFPEEEKWIVFRDLEMVTDFCNSLHEAYAKVRSDHAIYRPQASPEGVHVQVDRAQSAEPRGS